MKKQNRIIGVDFDGTLATIVHPFPNIGEPIQEVIDYIKTEQSKRSVRSLSDYARRNGIRGSAYVVRRPSD